MACLGLVYGLFKVGLPYLFTVGLGLVCCYFFFPVGFQFAWGFCRCVAIVVAAVHAGSLKTTPNKL